MTKKHSAAPSKSGRRGIFVGTGSLKSTLSNRISTKYPNQLYVMSQANANKANCAAIRCNFRGMETKHCFEQRKKSSRFSTRFRCERRGSKWQAALPLAAASGKPHCRSRQQAQAVAHRKQIASLSGAICGEMGRKYCFEQRKKSSRCPTRFRCEKRGSKWLPRLAGSGDDLLSRAVSSQVPSAC